MIPLTLLPKNHNLFVKVKKGQGERNVCDH
jgi:hypothetical protein